VALGLPTNSLSNGCLWSAGGAGHLQHVARCRARAASSRLTSLACLSDLHKLTQINVPLLDFVILNVGENHSGTWVAH
jgi:hypothetical protein